MHRSPIISTVSQVKINQNLIRDAHGFSQGLKVVDGVTIDVKHDLLLVQAYIGVPSRYCIHLSDCRPQMYAEEALSSKMVPYNSVYLFITECASFSENISNMLALTKHIKIVPYSVHFFTLKYV